MAFVVTLTGPSQCGKSTIRKFFMDKNNSKFNPVIFKKYTTRSPRATDDDVICVKDMPAECDLVYEQYGVRYGIRFDDLYEHLEHGESPIIVLNDVRAVEDVRTALWPQVVSLFLYRQPPDLQKFIDEESKRAVKGVSEEEIRVSAQSRFDKAKSIYRIYIENIHLFDNVILNTGDLCYTELQVNHVVQMLSQKIKELK